VSTVRLNTWQNTGGTEAATASEVSAYSFTEPALVLLDATDFTAASSVSVDNVFSSTYNNYVIMFSSSDASAAAGYLFFRLRASGVDESSGTNHYRYNRQFTYTSTSGQDGSDNSKWDIGEVSSSWPDISSFQMTLWNPAVAQRTTAYTVSHKASSSSTNVQQTVASLHKLQTAYDGFTLYPASGTFAGKIRVYGMADS